ncbi:MAG: peptidoglycan bridge formation glycyltransferase FemA/FemB family protein [Patescibacteria group bacterium]
MNNLFFQELKKNESFDPLTLCLVAPFTQAEFYGRWQESLDREVRRFVVWQNDRAIAYFQLIRYRLVYNKSYLYVPYGPVVTEFSESFFKSLRTELVNLARQDGAIFVRLDFTPPIDKNTEKKLLAKIFTAAAPRTYQSAYFQPRTEWWLNLNKTEDELLNEMQKGARYSVRTAVRKGVILETVATDFEKYFPVFYELLLNTAERNGFSLHHKTYYQNIFKNLRPDNAYLTVAKYKEKILVIKLVIRYGQVASCIFSGSSNEHRDRRPTYLAQWSAICQAKKLGHNFYNFGGVSSSTRIYQGWDGLTSFKKNFGGYEMVHSDFYDVVANPIWYHLYNLGKFIKNLIKIFRSGR